MKGASILKREIDFLEKSFTYFPKKIWDLVFNFPYRKIALLIFVSAISYFLFKTPEVQSLVSSLDNLEYLGIFIAGIFFTFGFTTPLAIGFFIILNPENLFLTAIIGGLGAVVGDLAIFSLIRFSFMDEFKRLQKTKILVLTNNQIKKHLGNKIRLYLLYALAGVIIASPLPDEVGVTMLAGLTKIKPSIMVLTSFVFNSLGIFIICML